MNFLTTAGFCCAFGGSPAEELSIDKQICLVKLDGTVLDSLFGNTLEVGKTYTAKEFWLLRKSFKTLKKFDTEEEAKEELNRILTELEAKGNNIIKV